MNRNCVTTTIELLNQEGGRFIAAGSRRGPLMHVWHEATDGTVTRYEPLAPLGHWSRAMVGYPGRTVDYPQAAARPMRAWQIVASCWVLAITASAWAILRALQRPFS